MDQPNQFNQPWAQHTYPLHILLWREISRQKLEKNWSLFNTWKTADSDLMMYQQQTSVQTKQIWFQIYEMITSMTGYGLDREN